MSGSLEPGFYVVPRHMAFSQVLMQLQAHDSSLPISRLQRLNPTFEQGFKAGEIFVIGDPDNGDACTREEAQLMAAAERARRALAALDFAEADFMMQHQAEIAGLLSDASVSMGVGKDMLEQGLKQASETLTKIEQLHQREFLRHGHLKHVRLKETGSFAGGTLGGMAGSTLMGGTALAICGVFAAGTAGVGSPICGIVLVGAGSYVGGWAGANGGELIEEKIYGSNND